MEEPGVSGLCVGGELPGPRRDPEKEEGRLALSPSPRSAQDKGGWHVTMATASRGLQAVPKPPRAA